MNLFYSYDKGSHRDPNRKQQLEDNITRSFIVTVSKLNNSTQKYYLDLLLKKAKINLNLKGTLNYKLQSMEDEDDLRNVQLSKNKILITIADRNTNINKNSFLKANYNELVRLDVLEKKRGEAEKYRKLLHSLIEEIDDDQKVITKKQFEDLKQIDDIIKISQADLSIPDLKSRLEFIYHNLIGSRPDAWIYGDNFAILIESKIGNNSIYEAQIFRHLTHRKGFRIDKSDVRLGDNCDSYELINLSWKDIDYSFEELKNNRVNLDNYEKILIDQFKEYLAMTNTFLDLSFIVKPNLGYDREMAREQFPLFLKELDKKIINMNIHPDLQRAHKPLDYLWDYYGIQKTNIKNKKVEVLKDPHYSIYFDKEGAGIALTTKNKKLINKFLESQELISYIRDLFNRTQENLLARYSFTLRNYRLVDYKKGQIKGETFPTFRFEINFSELHGRNEEIKNFIDTMKYYLEYAKQVELLLQVAYPSVSKIKHSQKKNDEEALRSANEKLFKNHEKLLNEFETFVNDTKSLFLELVNFSKKQK